MKTLSDVSMEDVEMGGTGTHLIPTEQEIKTIYRALQVYEPTLDFGVTDEESKEHFETRRDLLDNLFNVIVGVKA